MNLTLKKLLRISIPVLLISLLNVVPSIADDPTPMPSPKSLAEIQAENIARAQGSAQENAKAQSNFDALPPEAKKIIIQRKLDAVISMSQQPDSIDLDWNSAISSLRLALDEIVKLLAHNSQISQ